MLQTSMPTYRMRSLITLFKECGGSLAFNDVLCRALLSGAPYSFVPHRTGIASFELAHDLELMCAMQVLKAQGTGFKALFSLDPGYLTISDLANVPDLKGQDLLTYALESNPSLAMKTEAAIFDRLSQEAKDAAASYQKSLPAGRIFLAVNTENIGIDRFLQRLIAQNIKILCDLRDVKQSRSYGFDARLLHGLCAEVGISYQPFAVMPKPGRNTDESFCADDGHALEKLAQKLVQLKKEHLRAGLAFSDSAQDNLLRSKLIEILEHSYFEKTSSL